LSIGKMIRDEIEQKHRKDTSMYVRRYVYPIPYDWADNLKRISLLAMPYA
jgi:hypothetical protein